MNTRLFLIFLLLLSMSFAGGCKYFSRGGSNKLVITYKLERNSAPITKELVGKQCVLAVSELTTTANGQAARIVMYSIYMANYDADPKLLQPAMPKADGEIKVEIQVVGAQGSTGTTPLKPGTYTASQFSDGINKYEKTLDVRVMLFDNGKVMDQSISTVNPRKGFVKITSVDDEKLAGEIDISDDFRSVKGEFSAKIVKK